MYSEQEEDYMRIIETKNDMLEYELKTLRSRCAQLKRQRNNLKRILKTYEPTDVDVAPIHNEEDFQRIRAQNQLLLRKYKQAQTIIEELRDDNEKLKSQIKYMVKK